MPEITALSMTPRKKRAASFTLVELLTVMAIILILASLMLFAGSGLMTKALRSRASTEIKSMSTGLEGYKTDNGVFPLSDGVLVTTAYATYDGTTANYQTNSTLLYVALSGQAYATASPTGVKSYVAFKPNQVGNPTGPFSYVKDPWGNSYGYSTGDTASPQATPPYSGSGFFDLWSTGSLINGAQANTNAWLSNWQ